MNSEKVIYHILANDATYYALVGGSAAASRIYYDEAPSVVVHPFCVIRQNGMIPNHTKTIASNFDFDFIQVFHSATTKTIALDMASAARAAIHGAAAGAYNGVTISTIRIEDSDSFTEQVLDKKIYTIEQIYKVIGYV